MIRRKIWESSVKSVMVMVIMNPSAQIRLKKKKKQSVNVTWSEEFEGSQEDD